MTFREAEYKQAKEEFEKVLNQPGRKCRNCGAELTNKQIFMCSTCINKIMG